MQTSADNVPDESALETDCKPSNRDSGLGSSLKSSITSEAQNTDNGTLSECDQIEPLSPLKKQQTLTDADVSKETKSTTELESPLKGVDRNNGSLKCTLDSKDLKDSFNSSKSYDRTGMLSPTSDIESRGDFLIDDEIADQPSLMVLNEPGKNDHAIQFIIDPSKSKDDLFTVEAPKPFSNVRRSLSLKNAEKRSQSHPITLAVIAAHRQSLCSTLSSCSSINSDDLMMDFDADR